MPIKVGGDSTTHVSDLTMSTTATAPSVCQMGHPQSMQYQPNDRLCHNGSRCVPVDDTTNTLQQVQTKIKDNDGSNLEHLQVKQMSDITPVLPGTMFRSIHGSTGPNDMMKAIGEMNQFPWDDYNQTEGITVPMTQHTMEEESIETVSGIEIVT